MQQLCLLCYRMVCACVGRCSVVKVTSHQQRIIWKHGVMNSCRVVQRSGSSRTGSFGRCRNNGVQFRLYSLLHNALHQTRRLQYTPHVVCFCTNLFMVGNIIMKYRNNHDGASPLAASRSSIDRGCPSSLVSCGSRRTTSMRYCRILSAYSLHNGLLSSSRSSMCGNWARRSTSPQSRMRLLLAYSTRKFCNFSIPACVLVVVVVVGALLLPTRHPNKQPHQLFQQVVADPKLL